MPHHARFPPIGGISERKGQTVVIKIFITAYFIFHAGKISFDVLGGHNFSR